MMTLKSLFAPHASLSFPLILILDRFSLLLLGIAAWWRST
jgi:hypothetical protein